MQQINKAMFSPMKQLKGNIQCKGSNDDSQDEKYYKSNSLTIYRKNIQII